MEEFYIVTYSDPDALDLYGVLRVTVGEDGTLRVALPEAKPADGA